MTDEDLFYGSVLVARILVSLRMYVFGHEQKWAFQAWHGNGVCGGYTPDFFSVRHVCIRA